MKNFQYKIYCKQYDKFLYDDRYGEDMTFRKKNEAVLFLLAHYKPISTELQKVRKNLWHKGCYLDYEIIKVKR